MKLLILFSLLFLPTLSFAQETSWSRLFESTFYSESVYESSQCTHNVLRYLRLAKKRGMNVSKIEVIELVNRGLSNFGLVGAQNTRGFSELDHERNWSHHVFLKSGETILDYDFTMKPTPTELKKYFSSMYLTERTKNDHIRCLNDLGRYEVTIYSGSDYLRYYDEKAPFDSLHTKRFFLKDTYWVCK